MKMHRNLFDGSNIDVLRNCQVAVLVDCVRRKVKAWLFCERGHGDLQTSFRTGQPGRDSSLNEIRAVRIFGNPNASNICNPLFGMVVRDI